MIPESFYIQIIITIHRVINSKRIIKSQIKIFLTHKIDKNLVLKREIHFKHLAVLFLLLNCWCFKIIYILILLQYFSPYLHYCDVLPDPLVELGGKLSKLFKFLLCLGIKQRMTWWRVGEDIIELGNVGDDRLLVRFGGINICND